MLKDTFAIILLSSVYCVKQFMKCQSLFPGKNKKNIVNFSSARIHVLLNTVELTRLWLYVLPKAVDLMRSTVVFILVHRYCTQKRVREKSRECHNHKPQPFPDTKRKRKPTKPNKHKSNKCTKSTKIISKPTKPNKHKSNVQKALRLVLSSYT